MESDAQRWDARWAVSTGPLGAPSGLLDACAQWLPAQGTALDLAAGRGRQTAWLVQRGLDVTAVDVSAVGLAHLQQRFPAVQVLQRDLSCALPPAGPWDLICCVDYLQPDLLRWATTALAPGGWLLLSVATVQNLERHARPSRRFLVSSAAVPAFAGDLEVRRCDADWRQNGRHEAWLAAQRR